MEAKQLEIIRDEIRATVNGKIDRLTVALEKHIEVSNTFMKEMEPLRDSLRFMLYLQRGLKFVGVPLIVVAGILWKVLK